MAVVQPFNSRYAAYFGVTGGDGSGDIAGPWCDFSKSKVLIANIGWGVATSTAGTLALRGSEDPALSALSITTLTPTVVHGAQPSAGTAGSIILVCVDHPSFVQLIYTRSAGGAANQFFAWLHGRSV